jgi:hypothetical protein
MRLAHTITPPNKTACEAFSPRNTLAAITPKIGVRLIYTAVPTVPILSIAWEYHKKPSAEPTKPMKNISSSA